MKCNKTQRAIREITFMKVVSVLEPVVSELSLKTEFCREEEEGTLRRVIPLLHFILTTGYAVSLFLKKSRA